MKDQEPKEPLLNPYLSRRHFLGAAAGIFASLFIPSQTARAQRRDPTTIGPYSDMEYPLMATSIGLSLDEDVQRFPFSKIEELGDGFVRYTFDSLLAHRPHIIVTKEGRVVFKRKVMPPLMGGLVYISDFTSIYGDPEVVAPGETTGFSVLDGNPRSWETRIFGGHGAAIVNFRNDPSVFETHAFEPTSPGDYIRRLGQGDYRKVTSWPALILLDALGSSLDTDLPAYRWRDEGTFGNLYSTFSNYPKIAHFSYRGGVVTGIDGSWFPNSYKPEDTYQDISKSAEILKETIEHHRHTYSPIDIFAYSIGGPVTRQYLVDNVLPPNGPHRNIIRSVVFLSAPLNGIPYELIPTYFQSAGILDEETQLGNPATQYLAALGRPEALEFTIESNARLARFLRDRLGINIQCLGNEDDLVVPPKYAIIPGFGEPLPLGRRGLGHTEILDHPIAISAVRQALLKGLS